LFFGFSDFCFLILRNDVIASTVARLVNQYGVDGVYIDQIAIATPKPCWDPTHKHEGGGGHYWTAGYRTMLQHVRAQVGKACVLTEGTMEMEFGV
jgi:hypothetical protein